MKITGIDESRSTWDKEIFFVTDPPLTDEIFAIFGQTAEAGEMSKKHLTFETRDGCLVVTRPDLFKKDTRKQVEKLLKHAVEKVVEEKHRLESERAEWFQKYAKEVGVPLVPPARFEV